MKILVTGGAGFIGSHTVDELIKDKHHVAVVDNFRTGKKENVNPKAKLYTVDMCNQKEMDTIFTKEKPEVVIHLAAQTNAQVSLKEPELDRKLNVEGTQCIIELCKKHVVQRIIFASSAAVYGNLDALPIKEGSRTEPISPYGNNKIAAEEIIKKSGIPFVILRYANVYGPRQDPTGEGGVVSIFFDRMKRNEPVTIHGDGSQTRDFIFVKDVARANTLALAHGTNSIFNISTNTEVSIKQLAEALKRALNSKSDIVFRDKKDGDIYKSRLDDQKAREAGLLHGLTSIEQGMRGMVE